MIDPQLDANFRSLSHADVIVKVGSIVELLTTHSGFELPWPEVVPNPQELKELVDSFTAAVNAAANGDRQKIALREATRAKLEQSVALTAQYLVMKSIKENDPGLLANTGFELKKRPVRGIGSNTMVGAPTNFSVKHGLFSGTLIAKSKRVSGAATYELQICQGDPTLEDTWRTLGLFVHCSRMEVMGLEPGKRFSFRVRGLGAKGPGIWSSTVELMVI